MSRRGKNRQGSAINSSTCHVYKPSYEIKEKMCKENIESIGPLTRYNIISPRYGGHGVMDGYEKM